MLASRAIRLAASYGNVSKTCVKISVRNFSFDKKDNNKSKQPPKAAAATPSSSSTPPENFYDEEVEAEKEFLDITTSLLSEGGITRLATVSNPLTWKVIEEQAEGKVDDRVDIKTMLNQASNDIANMSLEEMDRIEHSSANFLQTSRASTFNDIVTHTDLGDHLEKFTFQASGGMYLPEEYINYTIPWKDNDGIDDPLLEKFVPNTAPERFTYNTQGERACPGKLQRRGKLGKLNCHKIDLDALTYLDVVNLRRFLSDDAEILGKKNTGLCSKCQRKVAKAVKTARHMGLLPHIGQYFVEDSRPSHTDLHFHDVVSNVDRVESKTVY